MTDLYCLGGAAVDLVLNAARLPQDGEKLFVKHSGQMAGGFIANTACAAARLGLHTAWGGFVGNDAFGQTVMKDFELFGVETNDTVVKDTSTDFTVVLITPDGERTILVVPVLPTPPPLDQKIKKSLKETRIGYTAFYKQDWFVEAAQLIHSGGGKLAIDMEVNTLKNIAAARTMFNHTDIAFTNEEGLFTITGESVYDRAVEKALSMGPEMLVLTNSGKGATAITFTEQHSTGIYDVAVKDTTGAGDCFHAAFLYGILSDWDLQSCLDFAGAASAILIQSVGARNGLPTFDEVKKFMKTNTKEEKKNV